MLFWIFVIIAVVALIVLLCLPDNKKKIKKLEAEREVARMKWMAAMPTDCGREEYNKIRDAYYAADHAYDEARSNNSDTAQNWCIGIMIGALSVLLIMGLVLGITYAVSGGERARLEADYEVLSWEVENNIYQDGGDDVVGKKELYNQVREWNAELASNKHYEKDFWFGIFVPNIYSDLKPIELN
jgi:hypothetical protein